MRPFLKSSYYLTFVVFLQMHGMQEHYSIETAWHTVSKMNTTEAISFLTHLRKTNNTYREFSDNQLQRITRKESKKEKFPPLIWATIHGYNFNALLCLKNKVSLEEKSKALEVALVKFNLKLIKLLLDNDACQDDSLLITVVQNYIKKDENNKSFIDPKKLKIIKLLARWQNGKLLNNKDFGNFTPLLEAIRANNTKTIKTLIKEGANINQTNQHLLLACDLSEPKIIKLLLINGANPLMQTKRGSFPLESIGFSSKKQKLAINTYLKYSSVKQLQSMLNFFLTKYPFSHYTDLLIDHLLYRIP